MKSMVMILLVLVALAALGGADRDTKNEDQLEANVVQLVIYGGYNCLAYEDESTKYWVNDPKLYKIVEGIVTSYSQCLKNVNTRGWIDQKTDGTACSNLIDFISAYYAHFLCSNKSSYKAYGKKIMNVCYPYTPDVTHPNLDYVCGRNNRG